MAVNLINSDQIEVNQSGNDINLSIVDNANIGNIIVDSIRTKNMFDGIIEQGSYSFANGSKSPSSNYVRSQNKINVEAGKTYTLRYSSSVGNTSGFVFFNNGVYVGSQSSGTTTTIPSGANQLVFNIGAWPNTINPSQVSQVQLEEGSSATDYKQFQNLNSYDYYSTIEQRIGTWIDGKPLYRKVIEGTTASSNSPTAIGSISNLDTIVDIRGYIINSSQNQTIPINFVYNTEQNAGYREENNIIVRTTASVYQSKPCYIIVEYTKTTD